MKSAIDDDMVFLYACEFLDWTMAFLGIFGEDDFVKDTKIWYQYIKSINDVMDGISEWIDGEIFEYRLPFTQDKKAAFVEKKWSVYEEIFQNLYNQLKASLSQETPGHLDVQLFYALVCKVMSATIQEFEQLIQGLNAPNYLKNYDQYRPAFALTKDRLNHDTDEILLDYPGENYPKLWETMQMATSQFVQDWKGLVFTEASKSSALG